MNWFSPARRKAIYGAAAGIGTLLVLAGLLPQVEVDHWLKVVGAGLDSAALVMAVLHTNVSNESGTPDTEAP